MRIFLSSSIFRNSVKTLSLNPKTILVDGASFLRRVRCSDGDWKE